jgi:hypothetical protein
MVLQVPMWETTTAAAQMASPVVPVVEETTAAEQMVSPVVPAGEEMAPKEQLVAIAGAAMMAAGQLVSVPVAEEEKPAKGRLAALALPEEEATPAVARWESLAIAEVALRVEYHR